MAVSFIDVLKEFAAKKSVKLGKLLKERGLGLGMELKRKDLAAASNLNPKLNSKTENCSSVKVNETKLKTSRLNYFFLSFL